MILTEQESAAIETRETNPFWTLVDSILEETEKNAKDEFENVDVDDRKKLVDCQVRAKIRRYLKSILDSAVVESSLNRGTAEETNLI